MYFWTRDNNFVIQAEVLHEEGIFSQGEAGNTKQDRLLEILSKILERQVTGNALVT